jgi:hypothetical protein
MGNGAEDGLAVDNFLLSAQGPDADGDTVADPADNCPATSNEDQTNTDGTDDGGDACDSDDDNDGIPDSQDPFPLDGSLPAKPPVAAGGGVGGPGGGGPGVGGVGGPLDTVLPVLASASLTNKTFAVNTRGAAETVVTARAKKGTSFRYTLSENARVVVTIERATTGRKAGGKCLKQTRPNRKRRPCTLYVPAGRFATQSPAGADRHAFSGKIGRKSLKPGSYRATLVATDASGNLGLPKRLSFKIVKP